MCIISAEEITLEEYWLKVSRTKIFARHTRPGYQSIVYSLSLASKSNAAMILPLPVTPNSGEKAVKFIDLSDYSDFLEIIERNCVEQNFVTDFECGSSPELIQPILAVHDVGDFEASYVPSLSDFDRLDPRFRLADSVWDKMPKYSDYGFAVFQLKISLSDSNNEATNDIHPMAFEFPTRNPDRLFFPTVHVHDGQYHEDADYYHQLYCQRPNAIKEIKYQWDLLNNLEPTPMQEKPPKEATTEFVATPLSWMDEQNYPWLRLSEKKAKEFLDISRCKNLVDGEKIIAGMTVRGNYPNIDIWLGESL